MTYINKQKNDNKVAKRMYCIFVVGVLPLLFIFLIYKNNNYYILNFLNLISIEIPELSSSNSPLLSSVMSLYVKTSPLYGVVFFISSYKLLQLNNSLSSIKLIITFFLFTLFYFVMMFFLLAYDLELTGAGRLLRFLSGGDYRLTLFFFGVFYIGYILTCYYLSFIYAVYIIMINKLIKG